MTIKVNEETEHDAIENMLDRVQPDYPNLTRDELRELFHTTYERLASEDNSVSPKPTAPSRSQTAIPKDITLTLAEIRGRKPYRQRAVDYLYEQFARVDVDVPREDEVRERMWGREAVELIKAQHKDYNTLLSIIDTLTSESSSETVETLFPIQGGSPIPWELAGRAYNTYARLYGTSQSLERLAERGGFGQQELGCLLAGHTPRSGHIKCSEDADTLGRELSSLRTRVEELEALDICEFCQVPISAGRHNEPTFNVCGTCYNLTVNSLNAKVSQLEQERDALKEQLRESYKDALRLAEEEKVHVTARVKAALIERVREKAKRERNMIRAETLAVMAAELEKVDPELQGELDRKHD